MSGQLVLDLTELVSIKSQMLKKVSGWAGQDLDREVVAFLRGSYRFILESGDPDPVSGKRNLNVRPQIPCRVLELIRQAVPTQEGLGLGSR